MPLSDAEIDEAVSRYVRERDRYQKLTDFVHQACDRIIRENAIPATVQSRSKDPDRLRGKLKKNQDKFSSVDEVFGPGGFKDFTAIGDVTNTAARLTSVAQAGEIVLDADTHDTVADDYRAEKELLSLKGKEAAVEAFRLRPA